MQKITLMGNLGKDAQVRETSNGRKFVSLVVAVNSKFNNETKTSWYSVMWFNYNQNIVQYLLKGHTVIVGGDLNADLEVDQNGQTRINRTVFADYVTFPMTSKKDEMNTTSGTTQTTVQHDNEVTTVSPKNSGKSEPKPAPQQTVTIETEEDDLPF